MSVNRKDDGNIISMCHKNTIHENLEKNTFKVQLNTKLMISDGMKTKVTGFENDGTWCSLKNVHDMLHYKHVK